jgi:hypothetical protein
MSYLVTPDFSEETKPIEAGDYAVRVLGHTFKTSRNTGAKYLTWGLEVLSGEHEGKKLSHNTMLEGKGAGILRKFLNAARPGYDGSAFDADLYIGTRLIAKVGPEKGTDGREYMKVKDVAPLDQGAEGYHGSAPTEDDLPF